MSSKSEEKDRHSRTGLSGDMKKGGGGKANWGVGGVGDLQEDQLSPNDPNYVSEEEEKFEIKKAVLNVSAVEYLIQEYFVSGDLEEAVKNFQELNLSVEDKKNFVKRIINMALDKHAFERELTSKLLSRFYSQNLNLDEISGGFQLILNKLDDYVIDTPHAVEVVGKFLARAIVDEVVAPAFLKNAVVDTNVSRETIALANGMVTEKHRTGRLEHIWGPGDLSSVKRLKGEVNLLLEEYLVNEDITEAQTSIHKLNAPSFYFQIVKMTIRMGLQKGSAERQKFHQLLSSLFKIGILSSEAINKGFQVCYDTLSDLTLDVPDAKNLLQEFKETALAQGYLEK